jgi:hypothetical protein
MITSASIYDYVKDTSIGNERLFENLSDLPGSAPHAIKIHGIGTKRSAVSPFIIILLYMQNTA